MKGQRVLVTGVTGFIGRHLALRLRAGGESTVAVTTRDATLQAPPGFTVLRGDLRDRATLAAVTAFKPDVVFHLAAFSQVGLSYERPDDCFDLNVKATMALLDAVPDASAFVLASTLEVYGPDAPVPFKETTTPRPVSPYGVSKLAGELLCRARASDRLRVRVLRFSNVFGDGQAPGALIPAVIAQCLRGSAVRTTPGLQTRDFVHTDDVVDALLVAASHPGAIDGAINVCSGRETAVRDLVHRIAALTQTRSAIEIGAVPYRPNEVWRSFGDPSKAREALGWSPRVGLDEGLARTIAAARAREAGG